MPPTRRRTRLNEEAEQVSLPERRRRRSGDHESPEEASDAGGSGADDDATGGASADQKLAVNLIRYAIACEHSRTIIRRDGIKEKVLGANGRSFQRIFALAQTQLRQVWGMELRELPVREKMSLHEKRQAMKSNTQPKVGSGSYILTSTLPRELRVAAILKPSDTPSAYDESIYMGFYTLIVSVIWLSGGELSEQKLKRHLQRLNADRNVSTERTEVILKRMEKQGYVIKRVERSGIGQDSEQATTWHVGPRSREEIGVDGVMAFVREVYGESGSELEKKLRASLGVREP